MKLYTSNAEINCCVDSFLKQLKLECQTIDGIGSIVLIGSLSRNEGSWVDVDGKFSLVSDVEFWIICNDNINICQTE